ncbi:MAG: hypothetical protein ONB24_13335 [candidate division KSB1 bacterium]|nr:hypothetical protein [candidate division KSB1 bacterium]
MCLLWLSALSREVFALQEQTFATGDVFFSCLQRDGLGELLIQNKLGDKDAVAVLTLPDTTMLFSVYIRKGEDYQLQGIPNGAYLLWFATGRQWDPENFRFQADGSYERFEKVLQFTTKETKNEILYSSLIVTLYPVVHGNAPTKHVAKERFPRPKSVSNENQP